MSAQKQMAEAAFKTARRQMPDNIVKVRIRNRTVNGVRGSVEETEDVSNLGPIPGAIGAVRLLVSELTKPYPLSNDLVKIQEVSGEKWISRLVLAARFDGVRATLRLDYGSEFA